MNTLRQIDSLDAAPVGYYWLAVEGDTKPTMVAVLESPRGKLLQYVGVQGNYHPGVGRYRLHGPLTCPPVPPWDKPRARKGKL